MQRWINSRDPQILIQLTTPRKMSSPPVVQGGNTTSPDMMVLLHAVMERARSLPEAPAGSEEPSSNEERDEMVGGGSEGSHPPTFPAIHNNLEEMRDRGIPPSVFIRSSPAHASLPSGSSALVASEQQHSATKHGNSIASTRKVTVDGLAMLPNTPSTKTSNPKASPKTSEGDSILQDSYANFFLLQQLQRPKDVSNTVHSIPTDGSASTQPNAAMLNATSPLQPPPTNQGTQVTNEILRLLGITPIQPELMPPAEQQQVCLPTTTSSTPPITNSNTNSKVPRLVNGPQTERKRPPPVFPGSVKVTCRARGMPPDHCSLSAYFWIHPNLPHGADLLCCYPACRIAGVKFRYCKVCKVPAAKRSFLFRHSHMNEFQDEGVDISSLTNDKVCRPTKKCRTVEVASSQNSISSSGNEDSSREETWRRLLYERPDDEDDDRMSMWLLRIMQVSKSSL
eukprot:Nitzschia sp. Nitz4//scaffold175_size95217//80586//82329//NITZ4_004736-RA/size95217-snap-gene-0.64-mRNA-1//1//CDS//3329538978//4334//frame0